MTRETSLVSFALVALMVGVASRSHAQDYPSRLIRVIVGPGPDIVARLFGPKMTEALGQQVVIEPRPGPAGHRGADGRDARRPTATRCCWRRASYTINTALGKPARPRPDFAPIGRWHRRRSCWWSIRRCRRRPRRIDRAGQGQARQAQLCVLRHRHAAASRRRVVQVHGRHRLVHVPFREANSALNAVVSGGSR